MPTPTTHDIADLGKPIYDDSSGDAPIFGGSTPVGVYLDEVWIEPEFVGYRSVYIQNYRNYTSNSADWVGDNFSTADARLQNSYTQNAFESSVKTAYAGYISWGRDIITFRRFNSSNVYDTFGWLSYFSFPAFVYRVPTTVSVSEIVGIYASFSKDSKLTLTNAFVYDLDDLTAVDNRLKITAYTGYADVILDYEVDVSLDNKLILVIPNAFDSALPETDYTKTTTTDALGNLSDVHWKVSGLQITPTEMLFRVKA